MSDFEEDVGCGVPAFSPELVPDVILHMLKVSNILPHFELLKTIRLVAKSWNFAVLSDFEKRSVCVLTKDNISDFLAFMVSEASLTIQSSSIKHVTIYLQDENDPCFEAFKKFPPFFLAQLRSLKIAFENCSFTASKFERIMDMLEHMPAENSLEELHMTAETHRENNIPIMFDLNSDRKFRGNLPHLRKLTVPLQGVLPFLSTARGLVQLSLELYSIEVQRNFCSSFTASASRHSSSLQELCLVGKFEEVLCWSMKMSIKILFRPLTLCNFRLKKFSLNLKECLGTSTEEFQEFMHQQAGTLECLEIPDPFNFIGSPTAPEFPKLEEFRFERFNFRTTDLLNKFPKLKKIVLPSQFLQNYSNLKSHCSNISEVKTLRGLNKRLSSRVFRIFPNMKKLEVLDSRVLKNRSVLNDILTKGTALQSLSFCMKLTGLGEFHLRSDLKPEELRTTVYDEIDDQERWIVHERPIKADCFLLGFRQPHCKPFHKGLKQCTATTEFPASTAPSIMDFHSLKYLSLVGYFTELTIWAGVAKLTQLEELYLKSMSQIHPKTFLELETYLPALRSWSFTKQEEAPDDKFRDMYKFFRFLPNALKEDQFYLWKFQDRHVQKRFCTTSEFDDLGLTYNGYDCNSVTDCSQCPNEEGTEDEDESVSEHDNDQNNDSDLDSDEDEIQQILEELL